MLKDIKEKKVDLVIVKDLSRFGRNYIEVGKFIQNIFPAFHIRFIAITDCYDSLTSKTVENSILLPIKNFINDCYSKDISIKVRSQKQIKRERGEFINSFAVYGYLKEEKNKIKMDPYAANIVKQIFNWKIEGKSCDKIAFTLNEWGILSPMEHKKLLGIKYDTSFALNPTAKWSNMAVKRILINEIYTGVMVQGKRKKVSYKSNKYIEKPKKEWIYVKNTHKEIVSKDDFEIVQRLLKINIKSPKYEENLFAGILFCSDCKRPMIKRINRYKETKKTYYICAAKNQGEGCTRHSIEENILKKIVFCAVKKYAAIFIEQNEIIDYIKNFKIDREKAIIYKEEIEKLKEELNRYDFLWKNLSDDLKRHIIKEEDFILLSKFYKEREHDIRKSIQSHEKLIDRILKDIPLKEKKQNNLETSFSLSTIELDRHTLLSLVYRIFISENNEIEIEFNYKNEFDLPEKLISKENKDLS